jgi:hypothetical protein
MERAEHLIPEEEEEEAAVLAAHRAVRPVVAAHMVAVAEAGSMLKTTPSAVLLQGLWAVPDRAALSASCGALVGAIRQTQRTPN